MRALIAAAILLGASSASAYPQFQLSTGAQRCNQCHFAPAGGGLINNYGREEAGDTISMFGNGGLLYGAWEPPSWIAIGGDLRGAAIVHDEGAKTGSETAVFPMQADLYLRLAAGPISLYLSGSYRGTARDERSHGPTAMSREHYLMWKQGPTGWYARAGRFHVPYGLRLAEHTAYVRRWLDFKPFEEPYSVSGGYVGNEWELHVSAFTPEFFYDEVGTRGSGGAVYYERRASETLAYGAQAKVTMTDEEARYALGLVGKLYLEKPRLQLLAEVDGVFQTFDAADEKRGQIIAFAGVTWFPIRGLMTQLQLEHYDEDLAVKKVATDAAALEIQVFPMAHFEVSLYGRLSGIFNGGDDDPLVKTVLLQLHYYL